MVAGCRGDWLVAYFFIHKHIHYVFHLGNMGWVEIADQSNLLLVSM